MTTKARLRALISGSDGPLLLPGAPNALTARVIEDLGFQAVYLSGAGVTNSFLGLPDLGLMSFNDLYGHVAATADAIDIPLVVDADTGFGNAINVQRTVRLLERAGAAAIQIEDQVDPKRCGHFDGKEVISASEMVGKIKAALDARHDENLIIIARTDARAVEGLSAACERAQQYAEAGADILFVEAPRTADEMREVNEKVPGAHLANMVEGGLTPVLPLDSLREIGYSVVLYANSAMRGSVVGMRAVLDHLRRHGDTATAENLMIDWADRQAIVRQPEITALGERYA